MKVVILAGGMGTRMGGETEFLPKPMIEIGNMPMLWHIMKLYFYHGFDEFIICLGYKGYVVKEYFANYSLHRSDVTFSMPGGNMKVHQSQSESWRVTLVDTGLHTPTGGRLRRVREYIGDEPFMLTYGDGIGNIPLHMLRQFHKESGKLATVTAVRPAGRFGGMSLDADLNVTSFREKSPVDSAWINGGFFVLEPGVFDYIKTDDVMWEHAPLEALAAAGQLVAWPHTGFWQCMDTQRDKQYLEDLWKTGQAPWANFTKTNASS